MITLMNGGGNFRFFMLGSVGTKLGKINHLVAHNEHKLANSGRKLKLKDIDLDLIYDLARVHCTYDEIGAICGGVSGAWISNLADRFPEVQEALYRGYNETKKTLRKTQLDMALSGSVPMLIWLGKQYLGQSDQHKVENKTEISITVQRASEELKNIPREQLLEAHRLLSTPIIENAASDDTDGVIVSQAE